MVNHNSNNAALTSLYPSQNDTGNIDSGIKCIGLQCIKDLSDTLARQ